VGKLTLSFLLAGWVGFDWFYSFSGFFLFLRMREDRADNQNRRQQSSAEKSTHGASLNAEANAYREMLILGGSRVNHDQSYIH